MLLYASTGRRIINVLSSSPSSACKTAKKTQQIPALLDGLNASLSSSLIVTHSKERTKTYTVQNSDTSSVALFTLSVSGVGV